MTTIGDKNEVPYLKDTNFAVRWSIQGVSETDAAKLPIPIDKDALGQVLVDYANYGRTASLSVVAKEKAIYLGGLFLEPGEEVALGISYLQTKNPTPTFPPIGFEVDFDTDVMLATYAYNRSRDK